MCAQRLKASNLEAGYGTHLFPPIHVSPCGRYRRVLRVFHGGVERWRLSVRAQHSGACDPEAPYPFGPVVALCQPLQSLLSSS